MDAITGAKTTSSTVQLIAWIRKIEDRVEMTEAIHYSFYPNKCFQNLSAESSQA